MQAELPPQAPVNGDRGTSEATPSGLADQAKLLANPLNVPEETAAEHVRNALQLLGEAPETYKRVRVAAVHQRIRAAIEMSVDREFYELLSVADDVVTMDFADDAIAQRCNIVHRLLTLALPRLEKQPSTRELQFPRPRGAAPLELLPFAPAADEACVFCGCTETTPCDIKRTNLSEGGLVALREYFAERGQDVPDVVPCWWLVNTTEPVCSNPSCVAQLMAQPGAFGVVRLAPAAGAPADFAIDGRSFRLEEEGRAEPLEGR